MQKHFFKKKPWQTPRSEEAHKTREERADLACAASKTSALRNAYRSFNLDCDSSSCSSSSSELLPLRWPRNFFGRNVSTANWCNASKERSPRYNCKPEGSPYFIAGTPWIRCSLQRSLPSEAQSTSATSTAVESLKDSVS